MDDLMSIYIEDMKEFLGVLEDSILSLERNPGEASAISEMFRAYHTMKSSTAAMEFRKTAGFIHRMEDLLQEIREGKITVKPDIIKLFLKTYDLLDKFLGSVIRNGNEGDCEYSDAMEAAGRIISGDFGFAQTAAPLPPKTAEGDAGFTLGEADVKKLGEALGRGSLAYKLTAVIDENCVYRAVRTWMIFEELEKLSAIICSDPPKPDSEDFINGRFEFGGTRVRAVIVSEMPRYELLQELKSAVSEMSDIELTPIGPYFAKGMDFDSLCQDSDGKVSMGTDDGDLSGIIDGIIGTEPEWTGLAGDGEDKAISGGAVPPSGGPEDARRDQKSQAYIRIPAGKVDNLVDLLGELIITQSLHKQDISDAFNKDSRLVNNIIRMERIAKDIQDITMSLRMVSLKQTFQKICRIGRDTAAELGRSVEILIKGEETEIDRNIVEKIHDPMMHLIRNAISHGIEPEAERLAAGKPPAGCILIQACNRRGNVYIEISDDGKGLNPDRIYAKAVEKGLADATGKYSEDEILRFIYLPGFSTEESVNSISGRGVGMNVVQTEIARLGGKIEIRNSQGRGCAFILKIPVNLATINGTIVSIAGSKYIVPTLNIKQILKQEAEQWISIKGKRSMVRIRNEILQVIPISSILDSGPEEAASVSGLIMVVEHEQKLMALPVDSIEGKQEVVVKSIGSDFRHLNFVSGATILGDGRVSLILDIDALFKLSGDSCRASANEAI